MFDYKRQDSENKNDLLHVHVLFLPTTAGVIHSDIERGFIKAEVCSFEDFKTLSNGQKSMANVKAAGKYRQEGRNYVMQDGDIVHFMFNVTAAKKK